MLMADCTAGYLYLVHMPLRGWPSGLRRQLDKLLGPRGSRGFESHSPRHPTRKS